MKKNKHTDVVIVGAGAAGGIVAKELAVNGFQVVLLERGGWPDYEKYVFDELTSQWDPTLKMACGPEVDDYPRFIISRENNRESVTLFRNFRSHLAACVGAGTVTYGAKAWRFMPEDFRMKSTYGEIKDSTLEDWPLSYKDLEPFYEKAEWEIGVAGDDRMNPFAPSRKKDYPMPAFDFSEDGQLLANACKRLGLHPFPIPMARNSIPYNGRNACILHRACVGFVCPLDAKNGTHNTVIPVALKSGNCILQIHCKAAEILMDNSYKAIGVRYFDEHDKEQVQTADLVIIAAAAIESARLLLSSTTSKHPNGLGNNNDWVGRNLQAHIGGNAFGLFEKPVHHLQGPGSTVAICDYNHHNNGIIGGGHLSSAFYRLPYHFSRQHMPGSAKWGKAHKDYQRDNYLRFLQFGGPVQEIPHFEARVNIYPKMKDRWGRPVVAFSGSRHPRDGETTKFIADRAEEVLKEAGAKTIWKQHGSGGLGAGHHQVGTCRMGDDPTKSVVNKFGQIHDIENLYVVDGSVCVTGGGFNPVLTIMALAYWFSHHMIKKYTYS